MTTTKLFNVKANRYEIIGDNELDSALRSGQFRIPAGQTIRMQDAEGNQYDADNRTDFSQLQDFSFESGYGRDIRQRAERAATDPFERFQAGVEAVGRGATFGLSDAAINALGYAEEAKLRKEANPVLSTIGEIGGAVGSAFLLPFGGLTGGAAKLGQMTTSVAEQQLAKTVLATGATTLAKDIAKRSAYTAITKGAGGFVEGSLYGLGQTVSEAALGDPKEAAENLIGNMTFSGLVDGVIMGSTGALGAAFAKRIPPGMSKAEFDKAQRSVTDFQRAFNEAEKAVGDQLEQTPKLASKVGETYLKTLEKFVPLSDETKSILRPLFTDPEQGKALVDFMNNPSEALQVVSEQMNKMVRTTEQASKFLAVQGRRESIRRMPTRYAQNTEAGMELANEVVSDLDKFVKTIKKSTDFDKSAAKEIELIKQNFASKFGKVTDPLTGTFTQKQFADNIELMNELNDVWRQIYQVKQPYDDKLFQRMSLKGKRTSKKLDDLYNKVVKSTFNDNVFSPAVAQENREISEMIAKHMASSKAFQQKFFSTTIKGGKQTRVFDSDKFGKFIRSDELKKVMQNDIFEEFMVSSADTLNKAKRFNIEEELFKEAGGVIDETIDSIANMKKLKTAMGALGALESHTGKSMQKTLLFTAVGGGLLGPFGAAAGALGYAIDNPVQMLRYINKAQEKIIENKTFMQNTLQKFIRMGKATAEGIEAIGAPVKAGKLSVPAAFRLGVVQGFEADSEEPITLEQMITAPTEQTVERVMYKHNQLNDVFPAVTAQMGAQTAVAIEFLKSKAPKDPNTAFQILPNQAPYVVPPVERSKFQRYVDAVNDPMSTLQKMADGTLTAEHVEALRAVYPKLYAEAQQAVLEMAADKNDLNFRQKVQLGLFLNVPTMPAYSPAIFASIQQQYMAAEQEQQGMKVPQTLGENLRTSFERAVTR